jgi:2-methylcitrate dehydratase PrpD
VKVPVANAALVNCILCNSFDSSPLVVIIDNKRYSSHTSGCTVPAAVTVGEYGRITGKELITSLITADDLVSRLQILAPRSGPAITPLGAAVVMGRVLGLNAFQMKNAFGMSLGQFSGGTGGLWDGSPSFKTGYGKAAYNGIIAARMAQVGWTGPADPFFDEHSGFFSHDCEIPEAVTAGLGQKFYVELVFKPYPGCRLTHAPICAALALVNKYQIETDDIQEATLVLQPTAKTDHCWKPFQIRSYPTGDALFSYRYSIANVLLRKRAINEDYTEKSVCDPAIQAVINKIKLETAPQMTGAELRLQMKDGSRLTEHVSPAKGDITTPLTTEELKSKFIAQVDFSKVISRKRAEELWGRLQNLEDVDDVSQIAGMTMMS